MRSNIAKQIGFQLTEPPQKRWVAHISICAAIAAGSLDEISSGEPALSAPTLKCGLPAPTLHIGFKVMVLLLLCLGVLVFLITPSAQAAGSFDPKLKWQTIETEHFYIHYHQGLESLAMETAQEAERVYSELGPRLDHVPRAKAHLVIADTSDFSNGETRIFPYPQILIFATPPPSDSSLDNYDNYIRTLLSHEYSHLLVMDMTRGVPAALRYLFGYSIAMNAFAPQWWSEGGAVYEETANTTAGRGRSVYMDMVLRCAILEKKFPSIDQVGQGVIRWPDGDAPYIFGGAFYSYLAQKFGEKKLTEFQHRYSGQLFPFLMNRPSKKIFGKDFVSLWTDWQNTLTQKYRDQETAIKAAGIMEGHAVTNRGYIIGKPVWAGDSSRIIFSEFNPHTGGSVRTVKPDGSGEEKLFTGTAIGSMGMDAAGERLAYTKLIPFKGAPSKRFYFYTDLYTYDLKTKKSKRLTTGQRASDPSWSPDGKRVAFVSRSVEGTALKIIEVDKGNITEIIKPHAETVLDTPRFSPDGSVLVFSAHKPGSGRDIYIIKIGESVPQRLTYHPAADYEPVWSHDGKYVLFISERTGVSNIFAIDMSTKELYQVTNVLGGAFEPAVSHDGHSVAYTAYSSKGYDLWAMPYDTTKWRRVEGETPVAESPTAESPPPPQLPSHPYRPGKTLLPKYILPSFWFNGVDFLAGISTGGTDPLNRHTWMAEVMWGSASQFLNWDALYTYSRYKPTVGIFAAQYAISYGEIIYALTNIAAGGKITKLNEDYYEKRTAGKAWAQEMVGVYKTPVTFSLGYEWEQRDNWTKLSEWVFDTTLPGTGNFSGIEFNVFCDDSVSYPYSISPEKGFTTRLAFEWLDENLGSDYSQRILTSDLRIFLPNPLIRHHVLALRAAGGVMDGDKLFQGTFRVGGSVGESIISSPGNKYFMLRGYDIAQFVGDKALVVSGEYRFPIAYPEMGRRMFPGFLQKVHGALFADYGGAFDRKTKYPLSINGVPVVYSSTGEQVVLRMKKQDDFNLGMGAELRFTGFIGWGLLDEPLTGRVGWSRDVTGGGLGPNVYVELGTSF